MHVARQDGDLAVVRMVKLHRMRLEVYLFIKVYNHLFADILLTVSLSLLSVSTWRTHSRVLEEQVWLQHLASVGKPIVEVGVRT